MCHSQYLCSLEYGNLVWGPNYKRRHLKTREDSAESNKNGWFYKASWLWRAVKSMKLPSLNYRRYRGDMIAAYNILHGKYNMDYSIFFLFFQWLPIPEDTC